MLLTAVTINMVTVSYALLGTTAAYAACFLLLLAPGCRLRRLPS